MGGDKMWGEGKWWVRMRMNIEVAQHMWQGHYCHIASPVESKSHCSTQLTIRIYDTAIGSDGYSVAKSVPVSILNTCMVAYLYHGHNITKDNTSEFIASILDLELNEL